MRRKSSTPRLHLLEDPGLDVGVAELVLGLALEDGVLELDRDRRGYALADVLALVLRLVEVVHRLEEALAEGREVRAAVGGPLAVDEGEVLLAVVVRVREGELDLVAPPISDIVQRGVADLRVEEVVEAVLGGEVGAVEGEGEAGVEVGVVPHPLLDELRVVGVVAEDLAVGSELDEGAVALLPRLGLALVLEDALLEARLELAALAIGDDAERGGEGVDGLGADPVEADGELEHVVVVFRARVDDRDGLDDLAQGNAPAVVADWTTQRRSRVSLSSLESQRRSCRRRP